MAVQLFGGFANGVSDSHAIDMRRFFPQISQALNSVTNGDLIKLTMREFSMAFIQWVPADQLPEGIKKEFDELLRKKEAASDEEKAVIQSQIDELANNALWNWVDESGRSEEDIKEDVYNYPNDHEA